MRLYVIVDDDDHADPDYHVRDSLDEALALANECVERSQKHYSEEGCVLDCTAVPNWHFSKYGLGGSWKVQVREVLMPQEGMAVRVGTYIGPEERFRGCRALLQVGNEKCLAQFNEGALWQTHSWLAFAVKDWELDDE